MGPHNDGTVKVRIVKLHVQPFFVVEKNGLVLGELSAQQPLVVFERHLASISGLLNELVRNVEHGEQVKQIVAQDDGDRSVPD
jgi:hypothetical protein